jgi:murein DD-endopeptidase MepM/ murein hydrolase activator NlpD
MVPQASASRSWRKLICVATGVMVLSTSAGATLAGAQGGGGVGTPDPPELTDVICLERCADVRVATVGSKIQLRGRDLDAVDEVRFPGDGAGRVVASPTAVTARTVQAKVPEGAATGTVIVDAYGTTAETPAERELRIVPPGQIESSGDFNLSSAEASPRSSFYDAKRPPAVTYVFHGEAASGVRVEVVNKESDEVVATSVVNDAEPNATNTATWDGLTSDGAPAPNGDYRFRIGDAAGAGAQTTGESAFGYHLYRFPLQAKHSYGDGYGAGRGHQGQDVMARCGVPIRAVRGGRVQANTTQSLAGNYLVIDGKGTGTDTFYAHLAHRSPLRKGARVRTGQVIGVVGQTGDATACHLHFEIWTAPGWYEGGDPMPSVGKLLRRWDAWS